MATTTQPANETPAGENVATRPELNPITVLTEEVDKELVADEIQEIIRFLAKRPQGMTIGRDEAQNKTTVALVLLEYQIALERKDKEMIKKFQNRIGKMHAEIWKAGMLYAVLSSGGFVNFDVKVTGVSSVDDLIRVLGLRKQNEN